MGTTIRLSSAYNQSLGYLPVIVTMLLSEWTAHDVAIYAGFGVAVLCCIGWKRRYPHITPIILYASTILLILLAGAVLFIFDADDYRLLSLTLELSLWAMAALFYLNHVLFSTFLATTANSNVNLHRQHLHSIESTIVSVRVLLIVVTLHILVFAIALWVCRPLTDLVYRILFHILPPTVLLLAWLFNQFGIYYFNRLLTQTPDCPPMS